MTGSSIRPSPSKTGGRGRTRPRILSMISSGIGALRHFRPPCGPAQLACIVTFRSGWSEERGMHYEGMIAETVAFEGHGGAIGEAYYARPLGQGPFGGVVLIHHAPGWD